MKKIVGIIAAAALAATAFAEVNIGLSANQAFAPIAYDGDDIVTVGPDAIWGGLNSGNHVGRAGISFSAENEVAGVVTDIHTEDFSKDNAYGYVKPFSFLQISAGKIDTNWRRLGFEYGAWNTLRPYGIDDAGDDLAFHRPLQPNFALLLTPIEGLEIVWDYQADKGEVEIYDELWNHARFGVSYTIADVGTVMAQLAGADPYKTKDGDEKKFNGWANVAFQLSGVENLDAQIGVWAPINFDYETGEEIGFGAGAHYTLDALTLHGFFKGGIITNDDGDAYGNFAFALGAGVDYAINDSWTLVADVRYINDYYNKKLAELEIDGKKVTAKDDGHLVLYAGVEHKLSNAAIRTGFAASTNSVIHNNLTDSGKLQDFTFGIPVVLDISF